MKKIMYALIALIIITTGIGFSSCKPAIELERLPEPTNFRMEGRKLLWDEVEHAEGYLVTFENTEHRTQENSYDLSELMLAATYEIELMAVGDGKTYEDSYRVTYSYTAEELIEHGYDQLGFEYTLLADKSGYEIGASENNSQSNQRLTGEVVIPDYFRGLPVKKIADNAFRASVDAFPNPWTGGLCNIVTTGVRLPAYLESIGDCAFVCMSKVEEFVIPDTVTEIGIRAFYGCTSLKRVTLPKGLKVIPEKCFASCALKEITFPDTLEEIGDMAFYCEYNSFGGLMKRSDQSFTKIEIPESVKRIGQNAFSGCLKLKEITLPRELEWFDFNVFRETAWLDSQPNGFVVLGTLLYGYKGEIPEDTTVVIPDSVKHIAGQVFEMWKHLTEIDIPDGVKLIGSNIFYRCESLKRVRLPSDLTVIPDGAFLRCKNLTRIEIPNGVTEIRHAAFRGCPLEEVVLPAGLETLGDRVFYDCDALTEVVVPASVKVFDISPFGNCENLSRIYYEGTEEKWNALKEPYNADGMVKEPFSHAIIYFYSESEPSTSGIYWHYVDGKPVIW